MFEMLVIMRFSCNTLAVQYQPTWGHRQLIVAHLEIPHCEDVHAEESTRAHTHGLTSSDLKRTVPSSRHLWTSGLRSTRLGTWPAITKPLQGYRKILGHPLIIFFMYYAKHTVIRLNPHQFACIEPFKSEWSCLL